MNTWLLVGVVGLLMVVAVVAVALLGWRPGRGVELVSDYDGNPVGIVEAERADAAEAAGLADECGDLEADVTGT